jgi:hypothetical protein
MRSRRDDATRRLDAAETGHLQVHDDDVWRQLDRRLQRLLAGLGLAHDVDLEVAQRLQQQPQPGAKRRVVVGDQQPERLAAHELGNGRLTWTRVPPPGGLEIVHVPPTSAARSRIDGRPTPGRRSRGRPQPSSWRAGKTVGGYAAMFCSCGSWVKPGYQRWKALARSSLRTRVRI